MSIPHRCTPFDLSDCARAHQQLRQDPPHLFQRARVLRWDLVSCSCCPPEFLQSTDSVVEKAAEQFDFASAERSTPVYNRVWSTFQLACPLTQGGENVPNRVSYCYGSRQLPPCSALGCPLIDPIAARGCSRFRAVGGCDKGTTGAHCGTCPRRRSGGRFIEQSVFI
jgi:hypothetical protein